MATAATKQKKRQKQKAVLAKLLIVQILLVLSCSALPTMQASAAEMVQDNNIQCLGGNESDDEGQNDPGFEVYTFDAQEVIDARANQPDHQGGVIIPSQQTPLNITQQTNAATGNGGSYLNTALVMLSILTMGIMLLLLLLRKTSDYRVITVRTVAVSFGLVTVVIWSLYDMLQVPTEMLNTTSALVTAVFSIFVIMAIASYLYEAYLGKKSASWHQE